MSVKRVLIAFLIFSYDISYIEGSNVPVIMQPVAGTFKTFSNDKYDCKLSGICNKDLRQVVADELKVKNGNQVVGTKSACTATNTDRFCCRNAYDKPETCKVSSFPAKYYSDLKSNCKSFLSKIFQI